jgi:hypothetical protein
VALSESGDSIARSLSRRRRYLLSSSDFFWNLILSPLWGRRQGRFEAVGPGRLFALTGPAFDRARDAGVDFGLAIRRHSADADSRVAALRREVESLGQSAAVKPGRQDLSSRRSHALNSFFSRSKLGISTERLRALTPAVVALLNSVTYQ